MRENMIKHTHSNNRLEEYDSITKQDRFNRQNDKNKTDKHVKIQTKFGENK